MESGEAINYYDDASMGVVDSNTASPWTRILPSPRRGRLGLLGSQLQPSPIRILASLFPAAGLDCPTTFMYGGGGHPDPYAAAIQLTPIIWAPPCTPTTAPNVPIQWPLGESGER